MLIKQDQDSCKVRGYYLIMLCCGAFAALLGIIFLWGWHTHNIKLLQLNHDFAPIKYNSSLGLLLCGSGLLFVALGFRRVAIIGSIYALVFGTLTLIEHIFHLDLLIDQLFMKDYTAIQGFYPGRIAPNTAICFVLMGIALFIISKTKRSPGNCLGLMILGLMILILSLIASIGYLTGIEIGYGWGNFCRMSFYSAITWLVLSIGVITAALSDGGMQLLAKTVNVHIMFSLALIILVVIGLISYQNIINLLQADRMEAHIYQVLKNIDVLVSCLNEIEAEKFAYLILQNEFHQDASKTVVATITSLLENLKNLCAEHPEQLRLINTISSLVFQRLDLIIESIALAREKGVDQVWQRAIIDKGKELMNKITGLITYLDREEHEGLHLEGQRRKERVQLAILSLITGGLLSFMLLLLAFGLLTNEITKRRQTEKMQERLISIIEATTDFVSFADPKGKVLYINLEGKKMLGIEDNTNILNTSISNYHPEWALKRIMNEGIPSAEREGTWSGESALLTRRGKEVPVSQVIIAQKKRDGTIEFIGTIMRDISERIKAEEQQRATSIYIKKLFETSLDPLVVISPEGKFMDLNKAAELMAGFPREKLIGSDFSAYFTDGNRALEGFAKVLTEGTVRDYPLTVRHSSGSTTEVLCSASLYKDEKGKILGAFALARDVTEQKRAEGIVRESEERFRFTFEQAAVGIAHVALDGRWLRVNQKLCEITGYPSEELLQKTFQDITFPVDLAKDLNYVKQVLEDKIKTYSMEKRYIRKDGSLIWVNITVSLVRDSESRPKYFVGIIEDISERKKVEDELARAKENADIANRAKSEFLSNVSHELRTPLNAVIGFTEILQDELFGKLNEKQRQYINNINTSGKHLLGLINDILDLSKIEAEKVELALQNVLLKTNILEASLVMFRETAASHNINLSLEVSPEADIAIKADPQRLIQIIYNLLTNAIKFTPDGGSVHIYAGRSMVEKDSIEISVEDTGIGIKQEDMPRLFQIFSQIKSPSAKTIEGTGLGLALTRKLVELHGGKIWAKSEGIGKGTTFTFSLPIQ